MTAQPAGAAPARDAGRVRLLHAVPDVPREAPQQPAAPPKPVTDTLRSLDRVGVTLLATPMGGMTATWIGSWWALGAWAVVWVALVVWTARGLTP